MNKDERVTFIHLTLTILQCIIAGGLFEWRWWAGILPFFLISLPSFFLYKAILSCKDKDFLIKLVQIVSIIMSIALVESLLALLFFPPALFACQAVGVTLTFYHYWVLDLISKKLTPQGRMQAWLTTGSIAFLCKILLIPTAAYCLTIDWGATILPLSLLGHMDDLTTRALECVMKGLGLQRLLITFLLLSLLFLLLTIASFYFLSSTFLTATAGLAAFVLFSFAVDFLRMKRKRQRQTRHPVDIVAGCAYALATSILIGSARTASEKPHIWEILGFLLLHNYFIVIIGSLDQIRQLTDKHRAKPKRMGHRYKFICSGIFSGSFLLVASLLGSYAFRQELPARSSPMPLAICIMLLYTIGVLDCMRKHFAERTFLISAIVFGVISVLLILASIAVFFFAFNYAIMEALVSSLFASLCFQVFCVKTKKRMALFASRHLLRQQAAAAAQQVIQQNYIQNYFRGDVAPGG